MEELRAVLAQAVEDIRHPALSLSCFTPYSADEDETLDGGDSVPEVPPEEIFDARLRRAALAVAAVSVVERCLDDLAGLLFDDDGMPDREEAEDSFVYEYFPPRHRRAYNESFFRKMLVTAVKVSQDLADPHGGPPLRALLRRFCVAASVAKRWPSAKSPGWELHVSILVQSC